MRHSSVEVMSGRPASIAEPSVVFYVTLRGKAEFILILIHLVKVKKKIKKKLNGEHFCSYILHKNIFKSHLFDLFFLFFLVKLITSYLSYFFVVFVFSFSTIRIESEINGNAVRPVNKVEQ